MKSTLIVLLVALAALAYFAKSQITRPSRHHAGSSPEPQSLGSYPIVAIGAPGQLRSSRYEVQDQALSHASTRTALDEMPAERRYMSGANLNIDTIQSLMSGNDFSEEIQKLHSQMRGNPDALELSLFYRSAIEEQLRQFQGSRPLSEFACGVSLCMGMIRSSGDDLWYSRWWNDFATSTKTPHRVAFDSIQDLGGGSLEHRFIFSNDPAISSARGKGRK